MSDDKKRSSKDFSSYIKQAEPQKNDNVEMWQTSIGLQKVDGLEPTEYLYEIAKQNIDGKIDIEGAKKLIYSYYESKEIRTDNERNSKEADIVSVRIREILAEKSFTFNPNLLLSIHRRLFSGVFDKVIAGNYRTYNISKKEWVLDGDSVFYTDADMIEQTLEYDFKMEKNYNYSKIPKGDAVNHIAHFVSGIWQIHPFGEGNTRTTAVFAIKYLKYLGFKVDNSLFENNSWYFRNALVRANYSNFSKNIYANYEYIEKFFQNLLLGEKNELKNKYLHVKFEEQNNDIER